MRGRQMSLLITAIGASLIAMSLLYLRPLALGRADPGPYIFWKPLAILASMMTAVGFLLFLLPDHLWWAR